MAILKWLHCKWDCKDVQNILVLFASGTAAQMNSIIWRKNSTLPQAQTLTSYQKEPNFTSAITYQTGVGKAVDKSIINTFDQYFRILKLKLKSRLYIYWTLDKKNDGIKRPEKSDV